MMGNPFFNSCLHYAHASGQTNPLDLPRLTDYTLKLELVTDGLRFPTTIAFLDSTHILALEKGNGTVRMIENGKLMEPPDGLVYTIA